MKKYRVWSEVNLRTLAQNLKQIKQKLDPEIKTLVVIKADAYGHGAVPVAQTTLEYDADMLGVGDSTEAIELRQAGILAPIVVLGSIIEEEIGWIVSYEITPTVHSMDMLSRLNEESHRQKKRLKIHLKIDTGMTRLGASPKRAIEIAKKITALPHLELEGVCTHHSSSFNPEEADFTTKQTALFNEVVNEIEKKIKTKIPLKHVASTGTIFTNNSNLFNMVRPGGGLFGIDPGNLTKHGFTKLKPVLSLKSQVTFLKTVPTGTPIGYGRTHVTSKRTKVATIPVGYNDGYPYHLSNKGHVLIRGQKAPLIGTVTMDYIMVDTTKISGVKTGDEVVLIGRQEDESITVEELSHITNSSPYVITCGLGKRVRRVYV
ncbi:MAG: alanine racemase [Planctomycetes bacterium]|nr:alanine racemase [Planctomycetota bacterium]